MTNTVPLSAEWTECRTSSPNGSCCSFQPEPTACTARNLHAMCANSTVNNRDCKYTSFTRLAMAENNRFFMLSANTCQPAGKHNERNCCIYSDLTSISLYPTKLACNRSLISFMYRHQQCSRVKDL